MIFTSRIIERAMMGRISLGKGCSGEWARVMRESEELRKGILTFI
jgi:hypothetical protein